MAKRSTLQSNAAPKRGAAARPATLNRLSPRERRLERRASSSRASSRGNGTVRSERPRSQTPLRQVSQSDLSSRRRNLRRKRGFNSVKGVWRLLAVGAAAAGLGWIMVQPLWVLRSPEQVRVKGTQTLSEESVRTLLPLEYPQSLLKVDPKKLEKMLLESAPLNSVNVNRQLLPPGLQVQIQERQPVAIAELALGKKVKGQEDTSPPDEAVAQEESDSDSSDAQASQSADVLTEADSASTAADKGKSSKKAVRVLLDEAGDWVPLDRYSDQGQVFELPKLKVLGMREEYRKPWAKLYQALSRSPVEVFEIDWRDPSNLRLQTELGETHLGPYGSQFAQQLQVLDRMRELPTHQQADQVDFIDLRSPTIPRLRMKSALSTSAAQ